MHKQVRHILYEFENRESILVEKEKESIRILLQDNSGVSVCDITIDKDLALCLAQSILKVATTDKE